jgi:hypothetical protein
MMQSGGTSRATQCCAPLLRGSLLYSNLSGKSFVRRYGKTITARPLAAD